MSTGLPCPKTASCAVEKTETRMLSSSSNRNLLRPTIRWRLALAAVLLGLAGILSAQQSPPPTTPESGYMRVLVRPTHPAVFDAQHRPITAGGFVDGAPVVFEDVTHQSGLDQFHHQSGNPPNLNILEVDGSGVALLDYDNDGWLDIYLLNGSTLDAYKGKEPAPRAMLLHNNHDGTFTDVTAKAGVVNERWGFGVAVGDYDNDGWPDIYVANFGKNRLYHNNHDGTF